ncbi:MAG: Lrp/AsnC family transcriptional regulator [Alicyclobacillus sp.]|nr:Lrp/AsnC family transcriptional regulator [Alicyclobacillus sp.]
MEIMDDISWQILGYLQQNARLSYRELAQKVNLSAPAVAERVRKLEDAGIITGYRAIVDVKKIGFPILAIVRMTSGGEKYERLIAGITEIPEVIECHRVTGSECFVLKVLARSMQHLENVINRLIEYGQVVTSIVLSSPLQERIINRLESNG